MNKNIMTFKEISYQVTGACFDVSHQLGTGFLEKVYEVALVKELTSRGIKVERQVPITVYYKDEPLELDYYADIIVEDSVILELKHVNALNDAHKAQLLNYLKATRSKYGMLINFGNPKVEIERFIY